MTACAHPHIADSVCEVCGACVHEVVLNGVCYFCRASGLEVTIKPPADALVPAEKLVRRKSRDSG